MPKKKQENPASQTASLTTVQITTAALNDPALSPDEFKLGDRVFKVVDLSYDDYMKFITLLSPLIDSIFGKLARRAPSIPGVTLAPDTDQFSVKQLFQYCGSTLPEMAALVCKASDPEIAVDEIKLLAKTPFKLADVILLQMERNNILKDFADFFARILPLMKR
jgi:hypothetical protein